MWGWLLTRYDGGSIFLINEPSVVLALLAAWFFIRESQDSNAPRLDLAGAAFAIAGVGSLVYGTTEEPARGWNYARVLGSVLARTVLLIGFVHHELRKCTPLVDLRLVANRRFSAPALVAMVMSLALTGVLFILTPFIPAANRRHRGPLPGPRLGRAAITRRQASG